MVQVGRIVEVVDNSGVNRARCIGVLNGPSGGAACVGDILTMSVVKSTTVSHWTGGEVVRGLLVGSRQGYREKGGRLV